MEKVKVRIFKMPIVNKVFNKNQKVYVKKVTGQLAYEVVGRRKGKFNYVTYWVRLDNDKIVYPKWTTITVPKTFADRLGLDIINEVTNGN